MSTQANKSLWKRRRVAAVVFAAVWGSAFGAAAIAADSPDFDRVSDVVYGRKFGVALTMDVFKPKKNANGLGLIDVISGGWYSGHEGINERWVAPFVKRGYTVFTVVHGSQPKFTIPEILEDMNRAVRYIRFHAKDYQIDPERIGIFGGSAGGAFVADAGMRREFGESQGGGSGRSDVEPGGRGRVLFPADRFPQLRQAGRERDRSGGA